MPYGGNAQPNWLRVGNRDELLRHLARTITRKSNATNFVLDRLNPAVERYVQAMEFQRAGTDRTDTGLQIVACLISLGLEVAMAANAPDHHREGMAADYVHWSGRLMRSEAAQTRFEHAGTLDEFWRDDVAFCARQITAAHASLGPKVATATARVLADAMVLPVFKDMLSAARLPIDHRYSVNERKSPCGFITKNTNDSRDTRAGRAAHNGLVNADGAKRSNASMRSSSYLLRVSRAPLTVHQWPCSESWLEQPFVSHGRARRWSA